MIFYFSSAVVPCPTVQVSGTHISLHTHWTWCYILSPRLFSVYIDDLSKTLSKSNIGCHLYSVCTNHLFYADDSVLLAPSPMALKQLIDICEKYSKDYEIAYNTTKTVCMFIRPKHMCHIEPVKQFLYGSKLKPTSQLNVNRTVTGGFLPDACFSRSAAHRPIFLTLNHVVKSTSGHLTAAAERLFGRRPILSSNDQIFARCPGGVPAAIVRTPGSHHWESCRSPQDANESHGRLTFTYG